jgi:colanic acid biosynthesis glycosyl transferase WcaI
MRILVVTQYFHPEQFKINDLCQALVERGHEVTVYTGFPNYPEGNFFKGYGIKGPYFEEMGKIKVIRSPLITRGKKKGIRLIANYFSYFIFSTILAPFMVKGEFDKIFVYEPSPITVAIPGIFLKYLKRAPMILWVTDLWPETLEATGVVKNKKVLWLVELMVKWIYRHTDKIFTTSRGFIPLVERLNVPTHKLKYWPQWAEELFTNYQPENTNYSDPRLPKGFILMFAGNIGTSQDFGTIVEAAKLLKDEKEIHFVVLGDGLMKSWADEQVEKYKLQDTFHLLGRKPLETMPYYYSKASVMLMSLTDAELFSITVPAKLQSYLACGKPVLASMKGEGAKIIEEWEAGMSCLPGRPDELAKAIERLFLLEKAKLSKMGSNAATCYQMCFDRRTLIAELEKEFTMLKP